jgi:DNA helicase II / ATP-dependent DNA helicase PcrA
MNEVCSVNHLLESLNPEQSRAVTHQTGPLLVLAGAGSGKTRVLTHQIAYRIKNGGYPGEVLAVTFTNKAAREMRERLGHLLSDSGGHPHWIGTFHSICGRILRREIMHYTSKSGRVWNTNFVIYDESEVMAVIKGIIKTLNLDEKLYAPKSIRSMISGFKNQLKDAYTYATQAKDFRAEKIAQIYDLYEAALSQNNAMDFDDMMLICVNLLQSNPEILQQYHDRFKHILVDEFQDTNDTQYELVRLLAEGCLSSERHTALDENHWSNRSLTVVGDIDQSIYSWRGANFRILLNFQTDFPGADLIKLLHNYRSTTNILETANAIIQQNKERLPKDLLSVKGNGEPINCFEANDDREEADYILERFQQLTAHGLYKPGDCCILYRTNVQSRVLEDVLISRGIPYTMVGGLKFYERKEIKDVLAYMTAIFNDSDSFSVKRVLNVPKRGIGKTSLDILESFASQNQLPLYQVLRQADRVEGLKPKAIKAIGSFVAVLENLKRLASQLSLDELIVQILDLTGYFQELQQEDPTDSEGRQANVQELVGVARQFIVEFQFDEEVAASQPENTKPGLADFLTQMSLLSDIDSSEPAENKVVLMTLHACKGLEFPVVAICGLEEGMLPHFRALTDATQMEEERRLMYVGVTRAMDRLFITYARRRMIMGELRYGQPSRFLSEIPSQYLSGFYSFDKELRNRYEDSDQSVNRLRQSGRNDGAETGQPRWRSQGTGDSGHADSMTSDYLRKYAAKKKQTQENRLPTVGSSHVNMGSTTGMPKLSSGDRVAHARFGNGTVSQVLGEGDKAIYSIQFDAIAGKKLLDPKFAKLEKVD